VTLLTKTLKKRRLGRRFFVVMAVIAPAASAQQPFMAVQPVIDMLLRDEAELASAIAAKDFERLQRLHLANRQAEFELVKRDPPIVPSDPVAVALRAAHVACANAHSSVGMLASNAVQVLITNNGGDNTKVDNDSNRSSMDFFLAPFLKQRERCAERSGLALLATPLKEKASALFSPFTQVRTSRLSTDDRAELTRRVAGLRQAESVAASAWATSAIAPLTDTVVSLTSLSAWLKTRDDPDMPRRDYAVLKECRWAISHAQQLLNGLLEGLVRPDIRGAQLDQARGTLDQYQDTKASCSRILGLAPTESAIDPALILAISR
jgi:hypothetical protein